MFDTSNFFQSEVVFFFYYIFFLRISYKGLYFIPDFKGMDITKPDVWSFSQWVN